MANIIEEFLDRREYDYIKVTDRKTHDNYTTKTESYMISGSETLDGLKLTIIVSTAYLGTIPAAQDFTIKSNRGVTMHTTAGSVFDELRKFL